MAINYLPCLFMVSQLPLIRLTTLIYSLALDKELIVELNGAVSFNCTASSSDQQLSWYDGSLLVNSAQDHHGVIVMETDSSTVTINIANVTPYHYGNYKCIDIVSEEVVKTVAVMPSSSRNGE